jgi:hypothetical protein
MELPYDAFLYLKAVNEGVPVVIGAPRTPAADALNRLSAIAFGAETAGLAAPTEGRKSGRFGFRRR